MRRVGLVEAASLATGHLGLKRIGVTADRTEVREGHVDAPAAFAPEAHLPRERRLLVDAAGVFLEAGLGVRHAFPWHACEAVLVWPDRAELILNDEVSVVVRSADWHQGRAAIESIRQRAPEQVLVVMPDDPEPAAPAYVLRGLAASSGVVLVILALSLALVAAIGIGVGEQDHRGSALILGVIFGAAALGVTRSLLIRLHVPRRWRASAAVRGRTSVAVDARIATASDRALAVAEPALYALAGLIVGLALTLRNFNPLPAVFLAGLGFAVRRERARRSRRQGDR